MGETVPKHANLYRSAYAAGAITPHDVLAYHRATFGSARMADPTTDPPAGGDDGGADGGDDGGAGAPPAASFTDPDSGETYAFRPNTKVADMTADEKAEYWRHKARKHENRNKATADYDTLKAENEKLKQAGMTADEKALENARAEARTAARREAAKDTADELLRVRLAARGKKDDEIAAALQYVNLDKFVDDKTGKVNRDEITKFVDATAAPAGDKWPDMGGGQRGNDLKPKKGEAGRAEAERRYPKK